GGAEAALQAVILAEGFLHRMQLAVLRQALDRQDVRALGLPGEHGAGFDRLAVDMDDAGAALRGVAPDMGACQTQTLAQVLDQPRCPDGPCRFAVRGGGHRAKKSMDMQAYKVV